MNFRWLACLIVLHTAAGLLVPPEGEIESFPMLAKVKDLVQTQLHTDNPRNVTDEILVFLKTFLGFDPTAKDRLKPGLKLATLAASAVVKPLFIFSTAKKLDLGKLTQKMAVDLISRSAPFALPAARLADYFIAVAGNSSRADSHHIHRSLSFGKGFHDQDMSVVGFIFSDHLANDSFVLGTNHAAAEAYDVLAKYWVDQIGLPNFLLSSFCTISTTDADDGYCISIKEGKEVVLSPATASLLPISKRAETMDEQDSDDQVDEDNVNDNDEGDSEEIEPIIFESQVIRQFHRKLFDLAMLINDNYEHANENPLEFVENLDIKIDDSINNMKEGLSEAKDRMMLIPEKVTNVVNNYIDQSIERLADSRFSVDPEEEYGSYGYAFQRLDSDSDSDDDYLTKRGNEKLRKFEDEIVVPLTFVHATQVYPRPKSYKQMAVQLLVKREDVDCVPVTWYNVFHHSIFGTAHFCD